MTHIKKGFTLIEMLIVVAIIALLASIVVVSVQKSAQTARDARRQTDIKTLKSAIEQYANNNSGKYPNLSPAQNVVGLTTALQPYVNPIPTDPTSTKSYTYLGTNTNYGLRVEFEGITFASGGKICQTGLIGPTTDPVWSAWTNDSCGF